MKKTLALLLLLNTTLLLTSQITYDKRIEFELKDGYDNEEIVEFGELGFIMVSREEQSAGGENKWKYEHYNTDLKLVDTKTVSLDKKLYSDETYTDNERTHTLYKDKNGNFSIVSVDASSLKITKVDGELPKKSSTKGITVLGDYAFLNATVKKAPFLFSVNWKTGQKNLIPISISDISPKKTTFKDLQILEDAKEIIVYAKAQIDKKNSEMYVVRLDDKGKKKDFFKLTKDIEQNIVDISASKLDNGKYIFTGTYSTKSTDLSEGLFFCQSEKGKVDFIKFYNFTKLENFLSYLPERKQNKLEKKKQRKEANDKELIINYRMATHEVIQLADGYLFLGEAFYPTYRTETYTTTTTSANGGTITTTHTRQVFDGYQYTHAVLSKFDTQGNLVWDQIFEMWPSYKPFFVKRFISVAERNPSSIKLVFASHNKITVKSFDYDGKVIVDNQSEEIQSTYMNDKTKFSFSNIDYWYGNYFIAYGNQKIKNKDGETKRKRKVYFINKIRFK